MSVQIIERDGQPEWAVLPYETYLRLVEEAEMLQDIHDFDAAKAVLESGEDELVPAELVYAIADGANPIKAWREYHGLSQNQLAQIAEISPPYLSQIETGKRTGTTAVLQAIAEALNLSLDDIVIKREDEE